MLRYMEIFVLILEAINKLNIEHPTPRYRKEITEYVKNKKPNVLPGELDEAFRLYWLCENY